jgi:hypothetical protein
VIFFKNLKIKYQQNLNIVNMKSRSINYLNILFIQLFGYEIQRFKNFKRGGTIIMEVTVNDIDLLCMM